jgi:copper chaperone
LTFPLWQRSDCAPFEEINVIEFRLPDVACGHCVSRVTNAVKHADPSAVVEIDLPSQQVRMQGKEDRPTVAAALAEAGYPTA